eukprot:9295501-Pyramimonas_sp.AAC.1
MYASRAGAGEKEEGLLLVAEVRLELVLHLREDAEDRVRLGRVGARGGQQPAGRTGTVQSISAVVVIVVIVVADVPLQGRRHKPQGLRNRNQRWAAANGAKKYSGDSVEGPPRTTSSSPTPVEGEGGRRDEH